jgi:hypothetical protein
MTPEQRAALQWALAIAKTKASAAINAKMRSATAYGANFQNQVFHEMTAHANALQALLNEGSDV